MFQRLKAHITRALFTLRTHDPIAPIHEFFALFGGVSGDLRRFGRLYISLIRKFRAAGATWREAFAMPLAVPAMFGGSTWITDLSKGMVHGFALKIAAYTASQTGFAVDMIQGFGNCFGILVIGVLTDGTHAFKMTECDTSGGTYTDIPGAVFGQGADLTDDDMIEIITFRRTKRFIKAASTLAGTTTGAVAGVLVLSMKKSGAVNVAG